MTVRSRHPWLRIAARSRCRTACHAPLSTHKTGTSYPSQPSCPFRCPEQASLTSGRLPSERRDACQLRRSTHPFPGNSIATRSWRKDALRGYAGIRCDERHLVRIVRPAGHPSTPTASGSFPLRMHRSTEHCSVSCYLDEGRAGGDVLNCLRGAHFRRGPARPP